MEFRVCVVLVALRLSYLGTALIFIASLIPITRSIAVQLARASVDNGQGFKPRKMDCEVRLDGKIHHTRRARIIGVWMCEVLVQCF